jgi:hypothetical protein
MIADMCARRVDFADGGGFLYRVHGTEGEQLVLQDNVFIEGFLPAGVLRDLEPEEMEALPAPLARGRGTPPTHAELGPPCSARR